MLRTGSAGAPIGGREDIVDTREATHRDFRGPVMDTREPAHRDCRGQSEVL